MKILVVAKFHNNDLFVTTFIEDQVKELCSLGNEVYVLVLIPIGKKLLKGESEGSLFSENIEKDGVKYCFLQYLSISRIGKNGFNNISGKMFARFTIRRRLLKLKPDLIHAHTLGVCSEVGFAIKKMTNCPLVITSHGSDATSLIRAGKIDLLRKWCNRADAIVCVGNNLRRQIENCDIKAPIQTIHNGFNVGYVKQYYFRGGCNIIQVSNLKPEKNIDATIKAFSLLKKKYDDFRLTIVGDGIEQKKLKDLCKELQIEEDVLFTGHLSNRQVLELMSLQDFFVMTSSPEGFGIVYLEAMASGCITIGSAGEGISDVIESGINGFLVPAKDVDAIVEVIDFCVRNPTMAKDISKRGMETAMKYTWQNNAKNYVHLFNAVIGECNNDMSEEASHG